MGLPVLEEVFLAPDELVVAGHDAGLQSVFFIKGKKGKTPARKNANAVIKSDGKYAPEETRNEKLYCLLKKNS